MTGELKHRSAALTGNETANHRQEERRGGLGDDPTRSHFHLTLMRRDDGRGLGFTDLLLVVCLLTSACVGGRRRCEPPCET